ncbi:cutinase-domain-containing protein [Bisporella sp. PMI_857]|nr:cutinase-domain-containing protein [Bisporella sp. PMI_857]
MRFSGSLLILVTAVASAAPTVLEARRNSFNSDLESRGVINSALVIPRAGVTKDHTANDWDNILAGKETCQQVGVIFARGTFDEGQVPPNIGVWVGSYFFAALRNLAPKGIAFQGVHESKYKASLADYLKQTGGSDDGGEEMAAQVTAYLKFCRPKLKGKDIVIIISGWSQGAIVSHKAIEALADVEPKDLAQVAGHVTFGDPNKLWEELPVSSTIEVMPNCIEGTYPDYLCTKNLPKVPTSIEDIKDPWTNPPDALVKGDGNLKKAIKAVGVRLLSELGPNIISFIKQLGFRVALLPQHFMYGSNGDAEKAAKWVLQRPRVAAALK